MLCLLRRRVLKQNKLQNELLVLLSEDNIKLHNCLQGRKYKRNSEQCTFKKHLYQAETTMIKTLYIFTYRHDNVKQYKIELIGQ